MNLRTSFALHSIEEKERENPKMNETKCYTNEIYVKIVWAINGGSNVAAAVNNNNNKLLTIYCQSSFE